MHAFSSHEAPDPVEVMTALGQQHGAGIGLPAPVAADIGMRLMPVAERLFRHDPKGRAADAYRELVKEVTGFGEKQRSKSADLGR